MCQWSTAAMIGLDQASLSFRPLWCTKDQVLVFNYPFSKQVDETSRPIYGVHQNLTPTSKRNRPPVAGTYIIQWYIE